MSKHKAMDLRWKAAEAADLAEEVEDIVRTQAARIRELEAENARLREQLDGQIDLNLEVDKYVGNLQAALAVAVDEVEAARAVITVAGDPVLAWSNWRQARAATDANELIRQYRASREQTR